MKDTIKKICEFSFAANNTLFGLFFYLYND